MTKDLLGVIVIATIVGDLDTTQMSAWLPTRKEKIHQKGGVEKMNHLREREGVEMIIMNEDPLIEARKGRTSHQRATQDEDIKLTLVNGYPISTLTTTPREAITPTLAIPKMKVLPVLH